MRGYQRKTDRLPYPHISEEFPGKIDTTTPYVIGKVVSRLEMDSRWALARSLRSATSLRENSTATQPGKRVRRNVLFEDSSLDALRSRPHGRRGISKHSAGLQPAS